MFVLAIDIEAAGGCPKENWATQLGAACIDLSKYDPTDPTKCLVSTFNSYIRCPEGRIWEERCVREFWAKHPEVYAKTIEECAKAPSVAEVMISFLAWIDALPRPIVLATDCPAFDFIWLQELLPPGKKLLYLFGDYDTDPIDLHSYMQGFFHKGLEVTSVRDLKRHLFQHLSSMPHDAVKDAEIIAYKVAHVSSLLDKI